MNNVERTGNYDESKLKIIKYGLTSLYLHITKVIVTFSLAYFLGIFTSLLKLMAFYSILRLTAFGVHAKKSIHCWIASLISFLLLPYLCEILTIRFEIKIILLIMCVVLIAIYAPADTEKRPLIHKRKRLIYKILSIITTCIYTISIFFIKSNILSNCIMFATLLGTIIILPVTYKLFGVSYNNYKNYKKE